MGTILFDVPCAPSRNHAEGLAVIGSRQVFRRRAVLGPAVLRQPPCGPFFFGPQLIGTLRVNKALVAAEVLFGAASIGGAQEGLQDRRRPTCGLSFCWGADKKTRWPNNPLPTLGRATVLRSSPFIAGICRLRAKNSRLTNLRESRVIVDEFTPEEMQLILLAHNRACMALNLTNDEKHFELKTRISALIMECAEAGERDLQKLVDLRSRRLGESIVALPHIQRQVAQRG